MASRQKIIFALTLLALSFGIAKPANSETKVNYKADTVTYEKGPKKVTLKGNVRINVTDTSTGENKQEPIVIDGEEIDIDFEQKIASTDKKFKITTVREGKNIAITGKSFVFNIDTKRLVTNYATMEADADAPGQKVYISGEEITVFNKGERVTVVSGSLTTCDHIEEAQTPHYNIKADNIDYVPNDRVLTWNSSIYIGGNKIYWYPFLYIPLKKNGFDFNLDAGKNQAEGFYVNFKNYYQLNDYHDGNYYIRLMEKKWLGLGLEHTWLATPTSASYAFLYGNVLNADYFQSPNEQIRKTTLPVFEDHEIYLRHEQWLPILPNAQTNLAYSKRNFYNVNSLLSPKDNYSKYEFEFKDQEIFQPFKDLNLGFNPSLTASYEDRIASNIDQSTGLTTIANKNKNLKLSTSTAFKVNDINLNLTGNFNNTIRDDVFSNTTTTTPAGTTTSTTPNTSGNTQSTQFFKAADNLNVDGALSLNYNILPGLTLDASTNYTNTDLRNFNKPATADLQSIQIFDANQVNQNLNSRATLTQDLNWGNLKLLVENSNDFLESDINQTDSFGNIIPVTKLTLEQAAKRNAAIDKRRGKSYINKLPQLDLTVDPFFSDIFPINLSGSVARILESTTYPRDNSTGLLDLVKTGVNLSVGSKDLDLGLGNKINFGGTGYEQNFYQTQDAQYKFTGQFNYKNDLSQYFVPSLNYYKVITDDVNNTPFSFDRFSRDKQDKLTGSLNIGNVAPFTLSLNNIGYDYQNKSYFSPNISLNSDFVAGLRFMFTAQTSYKINNITQQSLTRPTTDIYTGQTVYADKNKLRYDLARLDNDDFSELYAGYSKQEASSDVTKLTEEQLKAKYSVDKRLYDVTGKIVVDDDRLTENDIGKLELRGSRFDNLNLTLGVATPWEFGLDTDFGKEKDIPWGIATYFSTNYNIQGEDYYKPKKVYGVLQPITETQRNANFLQRFASNTSLNSLFVIGGNWLSHTVINLDLSLIPPELVAEGSVPLQTNRPFLPFNTYISIKKDLHDFILSFDFQNQYVAQYNKQDFMFSINLELTAFPFNAKDLTSQATGNLNQINSIGNQFK